MTKHYRDIMFTVVAEVKEHHVRFKAYKIAAYGDDDSPWWEKDDGDGSIGHTVKMDEADVFLEGYVKSDGCSNWSIHADDKLMLHCCDRKSLVAVGEVMARCWDITQGNLPSFRA